MIDQNSGDHGQQENPDPADRRTDCLPVPKTGIQYHHERASATSVRLECLHCTHFHYLIDEGHDKPEMIAAQSLAELVRLLPQWLAKQLNTLLVGRLESAEDDGFPCSLAKIISSERLLSLLQDRLANAKNLQELITDPPAILLDEYQQLFFLKGIPIPLRPSSFSYLLLLAETPGKYVRRDTIYEHLWPGEVNYEGTDKPYEKQVSDHKRKLMDEIKRGILGKIEIVAAELEAFKHAAESRVHAELRQRKHSDSQERRISC